MKIRESFFGEGTKIESLDAKQLGELRAEGLAYLKDWPTEVFSVEIKVDGKTVDISTFCIEKVKSLVVLWADGLGWDIDGSKLKDSDIQSIFSFLKGMKGEVDSDRQDVVTTSHDGKDVSKERVAYRYEIKGWKYEHGQDLIDIDGVINNVREI